jgi:CubicO group peptidase (beta-lactamase class C family)
MSSNATPAIYFPKAGEGLATQEQIKPHEAGFAPDLIGQINAYTIAHHDTRKMKQPAWALWRWGRLIHWEGDFDEPQQVASNRKTWYAMMVGAALQQGRIPSLQQKISIWQPDLRGLHAEATWWHVLTQSSGFDYPHGNHPPYAPGEMWTYSDWNLVHLCHALARVYGKRDFYDDLASAIHMAYFDKIGMQGWSTRIMYDSKSHMEDGVRLVLSLNHLGRLGLLALARGRWNGEQLIGADFVQQLETKQTYGMRVNYDGPYDGQVKLNPVRFPEVPYGFLTWTNTDRDYFPQADSHWALATGAGGMKTLWNYTNGAVFAAMGVMIPAGEVGLVNLLEASFIPSFLI